MLGIIFVILLTVELDNIKIDPLKKNTSQFIECRIIYF